MLAKSKIRFAALNVSDKIGGMNVPMKERAKLTEVFPVRVDYALKRELAILGAQGVDIPAMVRTFLNKEVPKIKKKLEQPA